MCSRVNSDQKTSFDQSVDGYESVHVVSVEEAQLFSLNEMQKHLEELEAHARLLRADCCSTDNYMPFYHHVEIQPLEVVDSCYQCQSFLIFHYLI